MPSRRQFVQQLSLLSIGGIVSPNIGIAQNRTGKIYTVTGAISANDLGVCLTHEHIMSNFGAERSYQPNYDVAALKAQALPYLKHIKSLGVASILDCTTAYFGRDVSLLKELSEESEIHLITNTGYYGAANDRYVPEHAYQETAEQLAERWINEFEQGIDQTGIRPGFIKIAADSGAVSDIDKKLMRAALQTSRATGLTIACHTGDNPAVPKLAQELMDEENVQPSAWIWTHAHQMKTSEELTGAAKAGMWISLDGLRIGGGDTEADQATLDRHLQHLLALKEQRLLSKVLISHDGNSFPRGGAIRPYEGIFTQFIPLLKENGFTKREINQLLVNNPQRAFAILE
ncbi:MAG: phosphotriesterase [Tunicatimonas sp.]|uniref:phosphotriesterase family protein n=1 Tax=Tunicatimonas sp. TaxID=1940096 RepID=UPI003C707F80